MEDYEMDGEQYGDPIAAEQYWVHQTQPEDCTEMSAADVVGQETGNEPSESVITTLAEETPSTVNEGQPVYDPATGSDLADVPELLAKYDVESDYVDATTQAGASVTGMVALENDLAAGDKIIASVDGPKIWDAIPGDGDPADPGHHDHDVVVTGVNTTTGTVYLNDSGVSNGAAEAVPIKVFEEAWWTSKDAIVVAGPGGGEPVLSQADPTPVEPALTDHTLTDHTPTDHTLTGPDPAGPSHGLVEATGVAASAAGATAAYWAYRRRSRRGGPRPRPGKPQES